MILLGTPKIGKTTFACDADRPVLIPVKGEEGADDMKIAKFPPVQTFGDLLEALSTLATEDLDYGTVIIDSSSTLEPLIWDETIATASPIKGSRPRTIEQVDGGFAKGYIAALKQWRQIMEALDYLRNERGMASIIIGHVLVKQFNDPMNDPYDQYQWNIHHKAASMFIQWADCILFAKKETFVNRDKDAPKAKAKGTGKHKLYTQERPAHPGGGRGVYGQLPYELDLEWPEFIKAVKEVSAE
jgi:hypothetical protein